jgi:cardiolipin synthase C
LIVIALLAGLVALALLVLRLLFGLPKALQSEVMSQFVTPAQCRSGPSDMRMLDDGVEAFAARRALCRRAGHELRLQYYMWRPDLTGQLMMADVLAAADRGVAVRLLVDDNTTAGSDEFLAAVNLHTNISVRLFNPFVLRSPRAPSYLFDFRRLNRRMHNKSFTADQHLSIVGGRNVGDEYFSAHDELHFADMDVLAGGPVVRDVAAAFDAYWTCPSSIAAERILPPVEPDALDRLRRELKLLHAEATAVAYLARVDALAITADIARDDWATEQVPVVLAVDDPAKGQGDIPRRQLLLNSFDRQLGAATHSIDAASAYFVPGREGMFYFSSAANTGRKVRILTNSLASNDVVPVHAGYARYRKRLLRNGVKLFELRASQPMPKSVKPARKRRLPRFGASSSTLHAKVFVLDRKRVFIGSFNFDPRSLYLNCEMGLLIESPRLGARITRQFDELATERAYQPFIDRLNRLGWRDADNKLYRTEPESRPLQRLFAWIISWLPVEWLL